MYRSVWISYSAIDDGCNGIAAMCNGYLRSSFGPLGLRARKYVCTIYSHHRVGLLVSSKFFQNIFPVPKGSLIMS